MGKAIVYIDGFNFYYGMYRNRKNPLPGYLKWVDYGQLARALLPNDADLRVRYFTADVSANPRDPGNDVRQQAFLRALEIANPPPSIEIHKGKFQRTTKKGVPVDQARYGSAVMAISTFEEKGSDVNIAAHLLRDAYRRYCDKAVVVSNDSDLAEPLRIARDELGIDVVVLSPYPWVTNDLKSVSTSNGVVDAKLVKRCQLPDFLADPTGSTITRPPKWTSPKPTT